MVFARSAGVVIVVMRTPDIDEGKCQRGETAYHQPRDNAGT